MKKTPPTTRLSKFKLHYEPLKKDRKPYLTPQKDSWLDLLEKLAKKVPYKKLPNLKPRWEWIVIAFLLGLLFARPAGAVIHDAPGAIAPAPRVVYIKPIQPLKQVLVKKVHTIALKPVAPPQPVYVAPVGVTNCGSDPNMAYIYQHESGCRTNAIGPNGPCGLGQALPCSKMPCSLSDWACQNSFFVSYAIRTYGSTYSAYLFWVAHSWW